MGPVQLDFSQLNLHQLPNSFQQQNGRTWECTFSIDSVFLLFVQNLRKYLKDPWLKTILKSLYHILYVVYWDQICVFFLNSYTYLFDPNRDIINYVALFSFLGLSFLFVGKCRLILAPKL